MRSRPASPLLTALARLWVAVAVLLAGVPAGGVQVRVLGGEHLHVVLSVGNAEEACTCVPCDDATDHGGACGGEHCERGGTGLLFGNTCQVLGPHHGHEHEPLLGVDVAWEGRVQPDAQPVALPPVPHGSPSVAPLDGVLTGLGPVCRACPSPRDGPPALEGRRRLVRSVLLRV